MAPERISGMCKGNVMHHDDEAYGFIDEQPPETEGDSMFIDGRYAEELMKLKDGEAGAVLNALVRWRKGELDGEPELPQAAGILFRLIRQENEHSL